MGPDEESKPESTQADQSAQSAPRASQRDRRGGRGRRGRGRGRRPKPASAGPSEAVELQEPATAILAEPEPVFELADQTRPEPAADAPPVEPVEERSPFRPEPPGPAATSHSRPPASVEQAIEEVSGIIDSLRGALGEMEEVLEMLELFERQKNVDEREIESLQRALRQMQRPRDGGHHSHR